MDRAPKWNMLAARTASAPASTAGAKCASSPAPPLAITGTVTAARTARINGRSNPAWLPSASIEFSRISPAPSSAARAAHPTASSPAGRRPPCVVTSKPLGNGPRRASTDTTTHCAPNLAADGQRDEDLVGGPPDHVVHGVPAVAGRGDVEENQLVDAAGVVGGGQLDRVAGVPQVTEADPLDHAAAVDVEAGDDPDGDGHPRTAVRACSRVNAPAYSALPIMVPSTPIFRSDAIARMSARLDTPPLAITGRSVLAQTWRSRSRFGPRSMPSFVTSVTTYRGQPPASSRASTSSRSPPSEVQPRAASRVPRTSRPTAIRSLCRAITSRTQPGFSSAAVPMITRSQPVDSAAASEASSRMPPDSSTAMPGG